MSDQALAMTEAQLAPAVRGDANPTAAPAAGKAAGGKTARGGKGAGGAKGAAAGEEAKGKKGKAKKGRKGKAQGDGGAVVSVASHPRAARHVRLAKAWGGLAGFGLTAYLSLSHGVSPDVAGLRALGAGAAGYVVAWGCSVMVWRQLMVAELRATVEHARAAERAHAEAAAAAAGEPVTQ